MVDKYKALVVPLIAVLILIIKLVSGVEVPIDVQDQAVDVVTSVIAFGFVIYGIFKNNIKQ